MYKYTKKNHIAAFKLLALLTSITYWYLRKTHYNKYKYIEVNILFFVKCIFFLLNTKKKSI